MGLNFRIPKRRLDHSVVGQDVILQRVANPRSLRRLAIGAQVANLPHIHSTGESFSTDSRMVCASSGVK
jgi:hypothetical protein